MSSESISLLRRGQVVLVAFDPTVGSETRKTRPAVVVSNNTANAVAMRGRHATITVVPLTSNASKVLPFQVLLTADVAGIERDSKAQAEQVRTIAVSRIIRPVGWVPAELMGALDEALRLHLSL